MPKKQGGIQIPNNIGFWYSLAEDKGPNPPKKWRIKLPGGKNQVFINAKNHQQC
jgi:hypothetical protein